MGRRATEFGVTLSVRYFSKKYPLKKSSICTWREKYLCELAKKKRSGEEVTVTIVASKRGQPLLLGEELDKQIQTYLTVLRQNGKCCRQYSYNCNSLCKWCML